MTAESLRRPPSNDGLGTGATLALVVHVGLVAALAWGVSWRRHDAAPVSAELWSAVPQVADAPAPPPPAPAPVSPPAPAPKPAPEPKPAPQKAPDADIATERKAKKEAERKEAERKEAEKREAEKKAADKKAAEKKEADKKAADKKAAEDKARDKAAEKADAERARQLREEQMRRLNAQLLGGGGAGSGGGAAAQSSGPSASYKGRVIARIRPNIIFNAPVSGHPTAVVRFRVAPDGTILLPVRLTKPSGIPEWDQAVLRAIERTEVLPRDVDGRVPPDIEIEFDPNDR